MLGRAQGQGPEPPEKGSSFIQGTVDPYEWLRVCAGGPHVPSTARSAQGLNKRLTRAPTAAPAHAEAAVKRRRFHERFTGFEAAVWHLGCLEQHFPNMYNDSRV